MLPTITLTLIVKKRDGLNAWSGKTTTISAMMARIISRKMSHNLIFGVKAVDAYLVGPYSSVYRAPRTAANRQRFHHYELRPLLAEWRRRRPPTRTSDSNAPADR